MGTAPAASMTEGRSPAHSRQTDGDCGPFTRRTADRDRPAVLLHDLLDGRKPQSRSRLLRRKKRFKDVVHDFRRDRRSIVLNQDVILDAFPRPMLSHVNRELSAGRHRFTGILENTEKDLLELRLISSHG